MLYVKPRHVVSATGRCIHSGTELPTMSALTARTNSLSRPWLMAKLIVDPAASKCPGCAVKVH